MDKALCRRLVFVARVIRPGHPAKRDKDVRNAIALRAMPGSDDPGHNFLARSPIRFGSPFLYCNWSRLSLFSSGIVSNIGSAPDRQKDVNAGAQLDFRIVLFSYMNSTFSVGYAAAAGRNENVSGEFMISLKLQ